jgi:putative SOS response-associated peptidase YedK
MCGRYTMFTDATALAARFHAYLPPRLLAPSYNAAPAQGLPTILNANPYVITISAWGFRPEWADWRAITPVINARAETVATKPYFQQAFRTKRCLVLADGFYEWRRTGAGKVPYHVALKTGEPFAFAGLWSLGQDGQRRPWSTFAIITTTANRLVTQIHPRMPVILHPEDEATWLSPEASLAQVQACLKPFPAHLLRLTQVSAKVNAPACNTPELLQPVAYGASGEASHGQADTPDEGGLFPASALA